MRHVTRITSIAMVVATTALALSTGIASAAPPSNDNFAAATVIDLNALPFSESTDMSDATIESGEGQHCVSSGQTIWYRLTPATTRWLTASTTATPYGSGTVSVYRDVGSGLPGLIYVTCAYFNTLTFEIQAGTTYYLQVGALCCSTPSTVTLSLAGIDPPVPVARFFFSPSDPSTFTSIYFSSSADDPGGVGFETYEWDFGDGTMGTGYSTTHTYGSDGDFTVRHTVTTHDGRSGDSSRVISVRTRDVAITRFMVPTAASVGQTRQISIGVKNTRYPETVRVELFKSTTDAYSYFRSIAQSEQFVAVNRGNRTTDFNFNYTFMRDDARYGKVTFKAVATLVSGRDAFGADNEAIAPPTKVNGPSSVHADPVIETPTAGAGVALAILAVTPNPAHVGRDVGVRLALPREDPVTLEILDLGGRVLLRRDLGMLGPGVHEASVSWNQRPSPGIYWVRLNQGGQSVTRKVGVL